MHDVTIPALGMAMTEAVLTRWYKQPGDSVAIGDVLAEIETDKSNVELEASAAGRLGEHLFPEGAAVPVGEPVVRIIEAGDDAADAGPSATSPEPSAGAENSPGPAPAEASTSPAQPAVTDGSARAPYAESPRQRRLAQLAAESGSAPATSAAGPAAEAGGRRRAAIASRVSESWRTIPHFSVAREIDASGLGRALVALRGNAPEATYTDLLLRALARAVETVLEPQTEGGVDIGLAVATADGVMMPAVPRVTSWSPQDLVAQRVDAVRRGREGKFTAHDLSSAAIASLSNLGSRGVDSFTGVVPLGQQVLLTVGRIAPRPVAVDDRVEVRQTIVATANVDHRALDGDRAAELLVVLDSELSRLSDWAEGGHA